MFRAASAGPSKAITANRLLDGRVVFLGPGRVWVPDLADAELLDDGPELEAANVFAKAQHDARVVVEPYPIDVEIVAGRPEAVRLRERIRAKGPTVDYGADEVGRLRAVEPRREAAE